MQALVIATGERNNLPPLTEVMPAPMITVANRPVMVYALELLARHGVKEIIVCLHAMASSIEGYFGDGRRWGVSLEYLLLREAWGTAGALKWAESRLRETVLALPADVLSEIDIAAALADHEARGNALTAITTCDGTVVGGFTGAYLIEPEVLALIPPRTAFDIESQLVPELITAGRQVGTYASDGYYNGLATYADYQMAQVDRLQKAWQEENVGSPLTAAYVDGRRVAPGIWVGRNTLVHPGARVAAPVYIGDNCRVGRDVELGPNAVIGNGVVIDDEATVCDSTILDQTYVGQLAYVDGRIVNQNVMIDAASAERLEVIDPLLLGAVRPEVVGTTLRQLLERMAGSIILLLLLPLLSFVGLLAWVSSGRVFTRVIRYAGRKDDEAQTLLHFSTRRADNSLTGVGRWLERLQWHRLPELWAVVRGKMALVGVKPLSPSEVTHVTAPWQEIRWTARGGFTGLWYVQMLPDSELDEVLIADAYFVATHSWREEIRVLLRTPRVWWDHVRGGHRR